MGELNDLALKYKTDKGTKGRNRSVGHGYTDTYERYLGSLRDKKFSMLEIGVCKGGSIKMWKEYFPNADLYGMDIRSKCRRHMPKGTTFIQGNQNDKDTLINIGQKYGNFDIIIDDGCHDMDPLITSFVNLWPFLKSGGLYIVEDMNTCYVEKHGGGLKRKGTFVEMLKDELDLLIQETPSNYQWMHFYQEIVFIKKA